MGLLTSGIFKKILVATIGAYSVAALGLALAVNNKNSETSNSITVVVDGVDKKTLSFDSFNMLPGEEKVFYLSLKSSMASTYTISLDFQHEGDLGLEEYINVEINVADSKFESSLKDLFTTEDDFKFDINFAKSLDDQIEIKYIIPSSVGNEAQGKTSDFNIILNISKE